MGVYRVFFAVLIILIPGIVSSIIIYAIGETTEEVKRAREEINVVYKFIKSKDEENKDGNEDTKISNERISLHSIADRIDHSSKNTWICKKCGKVNDIKNIYCKDCGAYK